ncbi:hypothetical protein ACO0QE_001267 [Hanseniaspora vineae]
MREHRLRRMFYSIKDRFNKNKHLNKAGFLGKAMIHSSTIRDSQKWPDFRAFAKNHLDHDATAGKNDHHGNCQTKKRYEQENKHDNTKQLQEVMSDVAKIAQEIAQKKAKLASYQRELEYLANGDRCEDTILVKPDMIGDKLCQFLEWKKAECVYLMKEIERKEKREKKMILQAKRDFVSLKDLCVELESAS